MQLWMLRSLWSAGALPGDAAAWVARMHARPLGALERRALSRWLAASPDHARELLRFEAVWRLSGALAGDKGILAGLHASGASRASGRSSGVSSVRSLSKQAAAACVALTLAGLAGYGAYLWQSSAGHERTFETAMGEQRVIALTDGSTVALNTASRLHVDYGERERSVQLESGEAFFQVTRDPARPFVVRARGGLARAVGTRFNVALDAQAVTVVVLDGIVEVAPRLSEPRIATRLAGGESAAFGTDGRLASVSPERASPERIVAWREGKLRFDAWSLEQAIAEHNRYASKPIRLRGGGSEGGVRLSGVFRIGDTRAFLEGLGELVKVEVVDTGDAWLIWIADDANGEAAAGGGG